MAINIQNLIDLDLLSHYDEKIKTWVINTTASGASGSNNIVFTAESMLPTTGEPKVLYVTSDAIYRWNGSKYLRVSGIDTTSLEWGEF